MHEGELWLIWVLKKKKQLYQDIVTSLASSIQSWTKRLLWLALGWRCRGAGSALDQPDLLLCVCMHSITRAFLWFQAQTKKSKQMVAPAASEAFFDCPSPCQVGSPPFLSFAYSAFWEFSRSSKKALNCYAKKQCCLTSEGKVCRQILRFMACETRARKRGNRVKGFWAAPHSDWSIWRNCWMKTIMKLCSLRRSLSHPYLHWFLWATQLIM